MPIKFSEIPNFDKNWDIFERDKRPLRGVDFVG